jgi:hypothetical protein
MEDNAMANLLDALDEFYTNDFLDRKDTPLPEQEKHVIILKQDNYYLCRWVPYDGVSDAHKGYLGTAKCLETGIGYHAWEQNDSEFRYYKVWE